MEFFTVALWVPALVAILIWLTRPAEETVDNDGLIIFSPYFEKFMVPPGYFFFPPYLIYDTPNIYFPPCWDVELLST